eukprot:gb/GECG01008292.1/.p1 GENE.gb/GECG01008292.1/~~gb/GECG01008292.1/.p1  ORF type:complete len:402 (+),score=27.88 gb/GECG01008292.1/:1-1206(+)
MLMVKFDNRYRQNYHATVFGTDYRGKTCGVDESVKDRKFTAFPRPNQDMLINHNVDSPADFQFYGVRKTVFTRFAAAAAVVIGISPQVCVSQCPKQFDVVCNEEVPKEDENENYNQENKFRCLDGNSTSDPSSINCNLVKENCWVTPITTSTILFRCVPLVKVDTDSQSVCIFPESVEDPDDPECVILRENRDTTVERPAQENLLFKKLNSLQQLWGRYFGDLANTWWVIVLSAVGGGIILGLVWLYFLKYFTGFIVWGTLALIMILLIAITTFLYWKGGVVDPADVPGSDEFFEVESSTTEEEQSLEDEDSNEKAYKILAYVMTGVTVITFAVILFLRKSIRIAINVLKLGADALKSHSLLSLFPLTTVVAVGVFMCWWIFVTASLMTAGKLNCRRCLPS